MKKEKDIVEFFNRYSEQLLPKEKEAFMADLKANMERLPVPSGFQEMDPERSKKYADYLIRKMKAEYRRRRRDAVIGCIFACAIMAALLLALYAFGAFAVNTVLTVVLLAIVALVCIGFIYSVIPFRTRV